MHVSNIPKPWYLSFSFGRALQFSCLHAWKGLDQNIKAAQDVLMVRAKANSEATLGTYAGSDDPEAKKSLYTKNYVY